MERLTASERERVAEVLTENPDLARAWALKEGLRAVYKKPRQEDAAAALENWIKDAQASALRAFQRSYSGTGIVLDSEGNILTNNHVVDGAAVLSVRNPESGQSVPARIVGRSPCDDLAVIQVRNPTGFEPAAIGTSNDVVQGDDVLAVGFTAGGEGFEETTLSLTRGIVSRVGAQEDYYGLQNLIQTDTPVNPGNSGGPLVDKDGRVIGVITLGSGQLQNVNFAVAIDEAKFVYEQLLEGRDIDWLGVNLIPNDPAYESRYGIPYPEEPSVVVVGLDTNSPMAESGWLIGDVLLTAEGQPLSTPGDLCAVVRSARSGSEIELRGFGQFEDEAGELYYERAIDTVPVP